MGVDRLAAMVAGGTPFPPTWPQRRDVRTGSPVYKEQERICRELGMVEGFFISLANQANLLAHGKNRPQEALPLAGASLSPSP